MRILVTGVSGYVGAALVPRLREGGHELRGLARHPARVDRALGLPVFTGDVVSGVGLARALDGIEVAYYLVHSMEPDAKGSFADRERRAAESFTQAAQQAGVARIVYLGGPVPATGPVSAHLASRVAVEQVLLEATPASVALRASIVIGARSRSFRFMVRLVERLPVLPLPAWRIHRSAPIDERDMLAYLVAAADSPDAAGRSLDIAGPETLSYGELIERIAELMLVGRPPVRLGISLTPVASRVAAAIAGEDPSLIGPLMQSLEHDLLPRDDSAHRLLGVRRHTLDAAIERSLREWERAEPLAAR
ncbi:MAG TPA: NAD(P)H-binding protein [Solirubrobacteraceae bacterium]|nr:NAD(P)H-binding protein [Solirubrobacteraceae bacterium]